MAHPDDHVTGRFSTRTFLTRAASIVLVGFVCYVLTSTVVAIGLIEGLDQRDPPPATLGEAFPSILLRFDGGHYLDVARNGYTYNSFLRSNVAFFPAYPLMARAVTGTMGVSQPLALVLVANVCLLGAFVMLAVYLRVRRPDLSETNSIARLPRARLLPYYVLAAFGLLPATFFFRMAYSEALFLLLSLAAFVGMANGWRPWKIALVVGAATATRPVGVALLLPLLVHLYQGSTSTRSFLMRTPFYLLLACWGILAFMLYQAIEFSDPLAFAKTQQYWRMRAVPSLGERVLALASFEPIWAVYDRSSPACWHRFGGSPNPLFNLQFVNPIYYLGTTALVALGAVKRWLNVSEWTFSAALLLIPYVTRSYEMCMNSQARFAAVAFPVYLVIGQLLVRIPIWLSVLLLGGAGGLLFAFSAAWAQGQPFF